MANKLHHNKTSKVLYFDCNRNKSRITRSDFKNVNTVRLPI